MLWDEKIKEKGVMKNEKTGNRWGCKRERERESII